jgi:hypothetical protein
LMSASHHIAFFGQPLPFSRRVSRPRLASRAPPKVRAARDAGVLAQTSLRGLRKRLTGPAGLIASRCSGGTMLFDEASSETPQVRHFSGVPRAVFEACSARPPVALPFQVRTADLTTAAGASAHAGDGQSPSGTPP